MTCQPDIQLIFRKVIEVVDCSILCGHRNEENQNEAFDNGFSQLKWNKSNHNTFPSEAIDVVPCPIDWDDINKFYQLNGVIMTFCQIYKVNLTWGGLWDMKDFPHYEREA